ncbi:hypothetical protein [Urbifossiella limnaea]|uniref:DUF5666 domain-containing protein n=1 Tax=Urbifossiella limnaea TaxID=2528023 RepID=A0A517XN34_9BACT|nr:hypothetical protein [Urbifossiella limnaea]QDU18907.1 hypothetical protein ETAA1_08030 [Urbifossiella limnaea]
MRSLVLAAAFGLTAALAAAQDAPPLLTAHGSVEKADKDTLTVKPRAADGKFQKAVALKVTGTSRVTVLAPQVRDGKVVLTQREAAAADLAPGQAVAVIYADAGKDGAVLLTAVAQPAANK